MDNRFSKSAIAVSVTLAIVMLRQCDGINSSSSDDGTTAAHTAQQDTSVGGQVVSGQVTLSSETSSVKHEREQKLAANAVNKQQLTPALETSVELSPLGATEQVVTCEESLCSAKPDVSLRHEPDLPNANKGPVALNLSERVEENAHTAESQSQFVENKKITNNSHHDYIGQISDDDAEGDFYFDDKVFTVRGVSPQAIEQILTKSAVNERVFADIYLNGQFIESDWVDIIDGQPCLKKANNATKRIAPSAMSFDENGCVTFSSPDHGITYQAASQRVDIAATEIGDHSISQRYSEGKPALRLNYSWFNRQQFGDGRTNSSQSGNFFLSGHYHGWVSHSAIVFNDRGFQHTNSYVTKDLVDWGTSLRLGDIGVGSAMISGSQIRGIEISNNASELTRRLVGSVSGQTSGPANIKIYQKHTLVHETFVVGGPFVIDNINLRNRTDDLTLKIEDQGGNSHEETHPVTIAMGNSLINMPDAGTYSLALGITEENNNVLLQGQYTNVAAELDWLNSYSAEFAAYSNGNLGMGITGTLDISPAVTFNSEMSLNYVGDASSLYSAWRSGINYRHDSGINASYIHSIYDGGRVSLDDNQPQLSENPLRQSHSLSLAYANKDWMYGNLRLNYAKRIYRHDTRDFTTLTYNMPLFTGSLSANYSSALESSENEFSINVNIPFGGKRYRGNSYTQYRKSRGQARISTRANANINDINTTVAVNYSERNEALTQSLTLQSQAPLTTWSASYNRGENTDSLFTSLQGGFALYNGGYALSASQISDTFAIIKVKEQGSGANADGVRLANTSAPAPLFGDLIKPNLLPYNTTQVGIDVNKLPNRYNSLTDSFSVNPIRGAVIIKEMPIERVTRAIVSLSLSNIEQTKDLVIQNSHNDYLGTVDSFGQFVLYDRSGLSETYSLWNGDNKYCELQINWTDIDTTTNQYLYKVTGQCKN